MAKRNHTRDIKRAFEKHSKEPETIYNKHTGRLEITVWMDKERFMTVVYHKFSQELIVADWTSPRYYGKKYKVSNTISLREGGTETKIRALLMEFKLNGKVVQLGDDQSGK